MCANKLNIWFILNLYFYLITIKKTISNADEFKSEKLSTNMAYRNEWPFPFVRSLTFLPSVAFHFHPLEVITSWHFVCTYRLTRGSPLKCVMRKDKAAGTGFRWNNTHYKVVGKQLTDENFERYNAVSQVFQREILPHCLFRWKPYM